MGRGMKIPRLLNIVRVDDFALRSTPFHPNSAHLALISARELKDKNSVRPIAVGRNRTVPPHNLTRYNTEFFFVFSGREIHLSGSAGLVIKLRSFLLSYSIFLRLDYHRWGFLRGMMDPGRRGGGGGEGRKLITSVIRLIDFFSGRGVFESVNQNSSEEV